MLRSTKRRGNAVVNLIVILVVLLALVVIGSIAAGWVTFNSGPDRATIDIQTKQMQDASQRAIDDASRGLKNIQENTGKAIEETRDAFREEPRESPPDPVIVPTRPLPQPSSPQPLVPDVVPGPPVAPEVLP